MNISSEKLVKLANKRQLPSALDRAWEKRTKINPVVVAIKEDESDTMKAVFFFFGLLVMFISIYSVYHLVSIDAVREDFAWRLYLTLGVFSVMTVGATLSTFGRRDRESREWSELQAFLVDLEVFFVWARQLQMAAIEDSEVAGVHGDDVQAVAEEALVYCATKVRDAEKGFNEDNEACCMKKGRAEKELTETYDLMVRFGLVSGGYGKFYKKADERLAKGVARPQMMEL